LRKWIPIDDDDDDDIDGYDVLMDRKVITIK